MGCIRKFNDIPVRRWYCCRGPQTRAPSHVFVYSAPLLQVASGASYLLAVVALGARFSHCNKPACVGPRRPCGEVRSLAALVCCSNLLACSTAFASIELCIFVQSA